VGAKAWVIEGQRLCGPFTSGERAAISQHTRFDSTQPGGESESVPTAETSDMGCLRLKSGRRSGCDALRRKTMGMDDEPFNR
jgi:hypothetical protein